MSGFFGPRYRPRCSGRSRCAGVANGDARHPLPPSTAQTVARPGRSPALVRSAAWSPLRGRTAPTVECPPDMGGAVFLLPFLISCIISKKNAFYFNFLIIFAAGDLRQEMENGSFRKMWVSHGMRHRRSRRKPTPTEGLDPSRGPRLPGYILPFAGGPAARSARSLHPEDRGPGCAARPPG